MMYKSITPILKPLCSLACHESQCKYKNDLFRRVHPFLTSYAGDIAACKELLGIKQGVKTTKVCFPCHISAANLVGGKEDTSRNFAEVKQKTGMLLKGNGFCNTLMNFIDIRSVHPVMACVIMCLFF